MRRCGQIKQVEAARRLGITARQVRRLEAKVARKVLRDCAPGVVAGPVISGWRQRWCKVGTLIRAQYRDFGPTLAGEYRRAAGLREVHAADRLRAVADFHRVRRSPPHVRPSRAQLIELFKLRFDPMRAASMPTRSPPSKVGDIETALEDVANLSEDRVLRQYLALILATTRTNFWRRDAAGQRRSFVSFKFDSSKVPGPPKTKP